MVNLNGWAALVARQDQENWLRLIRGSPSGKMSDPTHVWGGSVLEREGCALSEYFPYTWGWLSVCSECGGAYGSDL